MPPKFPLSILIVCLYSPLFSEAINIELKNPYEVDSREVEKNLMRFEQQDSPPERVKDKTPVPEVNKPGAHAPRAGSSAPVAGSDPFQRPSLEKLIIEKHFSDNPVNPHRGLALKIPKGKVISSKEGKVITIGKMEGYQKYIIVDHGNGFFTIYGNMDKIAVEEGQVVQKGSSLGTIVKDKSLYFQLNLGGKAIDPAKYVN
jgi:murein DD-endopeptidase MepM/ murein hydrolase activator NlpD